MLNPNLDFSSLANKFGDDKRIMVQDFIVQDVADRVRNACLHEVPFSTHYVIDELYQSKTREEITQLTQAKRQDIHAKIVSAASKGVGFLYEGYLKSRIVNTTNKELLFLHDVFDYFGSEEMLDSIRKITGNHNIYGVEPQYTRFTQGNFLTRHLDVIPGRDRLYAFVLGLSKDWHPDWGGLLQFYEKDGTPREAWTPQFNALSIFEVSHIHSVTYVTPFAKHPRISLTGWFTGG